MTVEKEFAYRSRQKQEICTIVALFAVGLLMLATADKTPFSSSYGINFSAEQNYSFRILLSSLLGSIGLFALLSAWSNRKISKSFIITQTSVQAPEQGMLNKTLSIDLDHIEDIKMHRPNPQSELSLIIQGQAKTIKVFRNRLQNPDDLNTIYEHFSATRPKLVNLPAS